MGSVNNNMWAELVEEMSKAQDGKEVKDRDGSTYMVDKMAVINDPVRNTQQFSDTPMYEGQKHSTHLMSDDDNLTAWPIIFQDEEGNWFEGGRKEAEKRGEIYKFDTKKEMTDFAREGNWKKKHGGGNHLEGTNYDLASEGMETATSDTDIIVDKYNLETIGMEGMTSSSDEAGESDGMREGGSVWDRKRYSTSAKKYRRGGESLPKYQEEGEVKLTDLEKTKKHRSASGNFYGGTLSGYEIQDFWCFECDMNNQTWREEYRDPLTGNLKADSEVNNWLSSKGYSAFDLLNWFYHTQYNIPFPGTSNGETYSAVDFNNRSTWEGQNYGYVRGPSASPLGTAGVPGHEYESESWFPNKSNTGNANVDDFENKRRVHAYSRDLMNIYPGTTNPWYFYKGQPYNNEEGNEQALRLSYGRAMQLHNGIVQWFNDDTYLHNMDVTDPNAGDLKTYIDKIIKQDYSYDDGTGQMVTIKDEDMQAFLKEWETETGSPFFSELTTAYDNIYKKCEDGIHGCKGSPYTEHYSHVKPNNNNSQLKLNYYPVINNIPKEVTKQDEFEFSYSGLNEYGSALPPMDNRDALGLDDHLKYSHNMSITPQKGFVVNGTWYPEGTHVLSEDTRTQYQRDRDDKVRRDQKLKNNIIDMNVYANPNALGRPFGTQSLEQDYGFLRNAPITAQEANDYIGATEGFLSTKSIAQWGVPGTAALKTLNVVSKIPLTLNKLRTGYGLFDKANKVRQVSNVVNTTSKINTAGRVFTVGDAANIGFGIHGYSKHGPSLVNNLVEGEYLDASGDALALGLYSWGVPSSLKSLNRGFLGNGRNITPQFNLMPGTSKEFGNIFPNLNSGFSKEGQMYYDHTLGPAVQNLPRYSLFNKNNQYNILKNMKKFENNYYSPYTDVTNAPNFMPGIIK